MARGRGFQSGGANMNKMMKEVQKLQKQMAEAQEKVDAAEVEATAGGGMVKVVANGKKEILSIELDPEAVDPDDVEMLQDMIMVAVNDALNQVEEMQDKEVGGLTNGLNLPGM